MRHRVPGCGTCWQAGLPGPRGVYPPCPDPGPTHAGEWHEVAKLPGRLPPSANLLLRPNLVAQWREFRAECERVQAELASGEFEKRAEAHQQVHEAGLHCSQCYPPLPPLSQLLGQGAYAGFKKAVDRARA